MGQAGRIDLRAERGDSRFGALAIQWGESINGGPERECPNPTGFRAHGPGDLPIDWLASWPLPQCLFGQTRGPQFSNENPFRLLLCKVPPIWWIGKAQISEKELQTCLQPNAPMTRTSVRKRSIFCSVAVVRSSGSPRNSVLPPIFNLAEQGSGQGRVAQAASAESKVRREAPLADINCADWAQPPIATLNSSSLAFSGLGSAS